MALAPEDRTLSGTKLSSGSERGSVSAGESPRTDSGWRQPSGWAAMADLTHPHGPETEGLLEALKAEAGRWGVPFL